MKTIQQIFRKSWQNGLYIGLSIALGLLLALLLRQDELFYQWQAGGIYGFAILLVFVLLYTMLLLIQFPVDKLGHIIYILGYVCFLFMTLFYRKELKDNHVATEFYLFKWWKYLFTNRIVFLNMIGNLVLFIPLGIILKQWISRWELQGILVVVIIVVMELSQYITKRGVFDMTDIILNIMGAVLGLVLMRKVEQCESRQTNG